MSRTYNITIHKPRAGREQPEYDRVYDRVDDPLEYITGRLHDAIALLLAADGAHCAVDLETVGWTAVYSDTTNIYVYKSFIEGETP